MSRDKLWYFIHDQDGKVAELDRELDLLDLDIALTQRHQFRETKRRLDDHGLDTTNYKPIPLPRPQEERSYNHFRDDDDIEALVIAATETPLTAPTANSSSPAKASGYNPAKRCSTGTAAAPSDDTPTKPQGGLD